MKKILSFLQDQVNYPEAWFACTVYVVGIIGGMLFVSWLKSII